MQITAPRARRLALHPRQPLAQPVAYCEHALAERAWALRTPGEPDEVAYSYVFLATEGASYMSGQVIHPNGGRIVNG